MQQLFKLGQIVISSSIGLMLKDKDSELYGIDLTELLYRHQCGDDGDVCKEDRASNQFAIDQGTLRIFSVYKYKTVTVWVITEHDRSYTTVLLPEDY